VFLAAESSDRRRWWPELRCAAPAWSQHRV